MSRLDCGSAEVKAALEDVSSPTSKNEWAVFGYVPKSGNVIKVDSTGSGFDDLVEEFSEGKVQFAYYRVAIKGAAKFVYVAWCGDGVIGMAKGSFANHSNDFAAHLKKGFAVHHQVNARSEVDLDEKKIQAALVKAAGANYDAGAKKQGMDSTAKAMGELKTFHISEQERSVQTGTAGQANVQIDKSASDAFWTANKAKAAGSAAPPPAKPAVDEEARKAFWQQQQQEQAAAKAAAAKQPPAGRPAPSGGRVNAAAFNNPPPSSAPPTSAPPAAGGGRPAPGKINTSAFTNPPAASNTSAPVGRPAPGGGAPKLPSSGPPKIPSAGPPSLPPSAPPSLPPSGPPSLPPSGPPALPPSMPPALPPSNPPPAAVPLPPRAPEPEAHGDDGWGDDTTAAGGASQDYSSHQEYAAQEEYAAPAQEEYAAQEGYAQEEYAQEEYAQEEYAATGQEEYAQEEYAQEEYAQEEYAQEEYAATGQEEYAAQESYTQVQALHDYAGSHAEDLTFNAGDWITVYERDESGWWKGEINGAVGYFPSNFVQQ